MTVSGRLPPSAKGSYRSVAASRQGQQAVINGHGMFGGRSHKRHAVIGAGQQVPHAIFRAILDKRSAQSGCCRKREWQRPQDDPQLHCRARGEARNTSRRARLPPLTRRAEPDAPQNDKLRNRSSPLFQGEHPGARTSV